MSKKYFISVAAIIFLIAAATALIRFVHQTRVVARGCFHQVAHKGSGCAFLVEKSDGKTVLQLTDFATGESSDLHVLLISEVDAFENTAVLRSKTLDLGIFQPGERLQEYVVPNSQILTDFHAVTVWNTKYQVNFTTAPLEAL